MLHFPPYCWDMDWKGSEYNSSSFWKTRLHCFQGKSKILIASRSPHSHEKLLQCTFPHCSQEKNLCSSACRKLQFYNNKTTQLTKNSWSVTGNKSLKDLTRGRAVAMKRTRKGIFWSLMIQRETTLQFLSGQNSETSSQSVKQSCPEIFSLGSGQYPT